MFDRLKHLLTILNPSAFGGSTHHTCSSSMLIIPSGRNGSYICKNNFIVITFKKLCCVS